jgi:pimeloyl-ACP methyl ester carboxylesterase
MRSRPQVHSDGVELWVESRGAGPDVLLIAGLGDPVEAWQFQLEGLSDRYRLTAFDNRGVGRTPAPDGSLTVVQMADDAAAVRRGLDLGSAHVMGFSLGSLIAQELALRHPDLVCSLVLVSTWAEPDAYFRSMFESWRWMVEAAPSERAFLEAFFVWIYTPRAHSDGTVDQLVEETLDFPYKSSTETIQRTIDALLAHETADRLHAVAAPTLVLAGGLDIITPPRFGRAVAERMPGPRFEVLPEEAHQPFQEAPEQFNARVDAFWRNLEGSR